jgi:branched-chain amino acid transport system substrate-binding protein
MITPSATHPETTAGKRCSFRVSFTDPEQSRALARFAAEDLGMPPAAVLYDAANAYNRDMAEVFHRAYEAAGGRVVAVETYTTGELDFGNQLTRIRESRPGILFLPNFRSEVEAQIRQARRLGIDATLLGGDAWLPQSLDELPEAEGSYAVTHWLVDVARDRAEARTFTADFRAAYGEDPVPPAANAFDAAGLLFRAITDGGSVEPASICRQLSLIEGYRGVTGTMTFLGGGGNPQKPVLIAAIRDGRVVLDRQVDP